MSHDSESDEGRDRSGGHDKNEVIELKKTGKEEPLGALDSDESRLITMIGKLDLTRDPSVKKGPASRPHWQYC